MATASVIALVRFIADERADAEARLKRELLHEAMSLLETDPGADAPDTQRALRRAAVAVEDGDIQNAEGFYLLGQQYVREVDFNRAEALFRRAIEGRPDWSKPHAALGRLLMRNAVGRRGQAEKELEAAIALEPGSWDPYDSLAILHRLEGELHKAYAAATKAVELAPDLVGPHNNLANLLVSMKRYEEAEQQYRQAIARDEGHAKPYYNLACLYSLMGRPEEAIEHLDQAFARGPSLRLQAVSDPDLKPLRKLPAFIQLVSQPPPQERETEAE